MLQRYKSTKDRGLQRKTNGKWIKYADHVQVNKDALEPLIKSPISDTVEMYVKDKGGIDIHIHVTPHYRIEPVPNLDGSNSSKYYTRHYLHIKLDDKYFTHAGFALTEYGTRLMEMILPWDFPSPDIIRGVQMIFPVYPDYVLDAYRSRIGLISMLHAVNECSSVKLPNADTITKGEENVTISND